MNILLILYLVNWAVIAIFVGKLIIRVHAYYCLIGDPDTKVYLRKSSSIYHKADCPILKGGIIKTNYLKVHHKGYEECRVCSPGGLVKREELQ